MEVPTFMKQLLFLLYFILSAQVKDQRLVVIEAQDLLER
jgi:hypothetical protein